MEDEVHDGDDVGEGLLLLAVKGALLEGAILRGGALGVGLAEVVEGLAEKAGGAARAVVDALAELGLDDADHGADEGARGVVLAAIAAGIAHALDLFLVELGELVLLLLGAEAEAVDDVDDLAEIVAALNLVLDFAEDLADLVLEGVGAGGLLLELLEVGEKGIVDEVAEVLSVHHLLVIELAGFILWGGPALPAVGLVEEVGVFATFDLGEVGAVLLEAVEVFEEEEPGGLLGVVELGGAAGLLAEGVVDIAEGLVEHARGNEKGRLRKPPFMGREQGRNETGEELGAGQERRRSGPG